MQDFGFGRCSECGGSLYDNETTMCNGCRQEIESEENVPYLSPNELELGTDLDNYFPF